MKFTRSSEIKEWEKNFNKNTFDSLVEIAVRFFAPVLVCIIGIFLYPQFIAFPLLLAGIVIFITVFAFLKYRLRNELKKSYKALFDDNPAIS